MINVLTILCRHERDIVAGRSTARHVARLLGFEHHGQIRIATAVSELTRAAAGSEACPAAARFRIHGAPPSQRLVISVSSERFRDSGRRDDDALEFGMLAARRLLERFDDGDGAGADGADTVSLALPLPAGARGVDAAAARAIAEEVERIAAAEGGEYLAELKHQNRELSSTLLELERKQRELTRLNAELADTNRGVMALYAELDERANHLRQADELKTKFLSYMSHEFRTPLNSILALSNILLEQSDGPLTPEQVKQVELIRGSSAELFELVSDLLDLAKVEAGKAALTVGRFAVDDLFGALRGMLRPLLRSPSVALEFDGADELPPILGDEGKVAQILRNFLSNALKFTESGSVRAGAELLAAGNRPPHRERPVEQDSILFRVTDTGIGISRADQEMIFEEFAQIRHSLQRGVRGTGLGLPLCRKLAALIGGEVWVDSELGRGSTFYLLVPRFHRPAIASSTTAVGESIDRRNAAQRVGMPLLVVSDVAAHRRMLDDLFAGSGFEAVSASGADVSAELLSTLEPRAAIVDMSPSAEVPTRARELLRQAGVPAIESSAGRFDRGIVVAAYASVLREELGRVLVVDDDEAFHRILTRRLEPYCRQAVATADAAAAVAQARRGDVDCAVLDLMMPDVDGFTLLARLRESDETLRLPVLVCSSKTPTADEWALLQQLGAAFLPKSELEHESLARGLVEACLRAPAQRRGASGPALSEAH